MKRTFIYLIFTVISLTLYSQEGNTTNQDTLRKDALNVYFVEASSFLKEHIPYINYVRDRKVADLVIIEASEHTGSGGREHTLFLEGYNRFSGMIDTLKYSSSPDETEEQVRWKEVNTLKMGLIRYVQQTPLSKYITINFSEPISSEVSTDRWNSWVLRTNINGFMFGESAMKDFNASGGFSANKITEDWKLEFDLNYSYGKRIFDIDGDTYISTRKGKSAEALIVKSIGEHWSVGGTAEISSSTYSNYDIKASIMPGIEYDVFPYSESTRRQFRFLYSVGYMYNDYTDTTIFDKTSEALFAQSLRGSFEVIQQWGSIDLSVSWSNYLRNFSENSFGIDGSISWRVAKGLNVNFGGSFAFIHNQISLVKGGATSEEIFLRQKELETNYNYFVHFGFSYTFGSIYNNVVNPRFGGSGGGRIIIMN